MNTTESRPFAAALAILKLAYHPPAECGTGGNSGLDVGRFDNLTGCQHQQILSAIRVLEAAEKVDKIKARGAVSWIDSPFSVHDEGRDDLFLLISSLPDEEK